MANLISGAQCNWGIADETTVGTAVASTVGVPNNNKTPFEDGQEWIDESRSPGIVVPSITDVLVGVQTPRWNPETSFSIPEMGRLLMLHCQNASETGAGPFVQAVQPDTANGKTVTNGAATATGLKSATVVQQIGQTTSRDIAMAGCIVTQMTVTIPSVGRTTVSVTFMGMGWDDGYDGSSGTYTFPTTEILGRDCLYAIGSGPTAVYSEEVSFTFTLANAEAVAKRYGGRNGRFPYKFILPEWHVTGSFKDPVIAGNNTYNKNYIPNGGVIGGGSAADQLFYVYHKDLASATEATSTWSSGEFRYTFNIKLNRAIPDFTDETVEMVEWEGRNDDTNNIWLYEQATTASQSWAG